MTVGTLADPSLADSLVELFQEIAGLGQIEPLDAGRAADGMRRFKVTTTTSDNDLLDLFTFHVPREAVNLQPMTPGYGFYAGAPGAPQVAAVPDSDPSYGFFDAAPGAPGSSPPTPPQRLAVRRLAVQRPSRPLPARKLPRPKPRPLPRRNRPRCGCRWKRSTS